MQTAPCYANKPKPVRPVRSFPGQLSSLLLGRYEQLHPDTRKALVMECAPGRAFRLALPDPGLRDAVRNHLLRLRTLWEERPVHGAVHARPVGRILGDFEYALRTRDEQATRDAINELRRQGRLSAQNHVFLEVLRWAGEPLATAEVAMICETDLAETRQHLSRVAVVFARPSNYLTFTRILAADVSDIFLCFACDPLAFLAAQCHPPMFPHPSSRLLNTICY